jgi:hypothetical protein
MFGLICQARYPYYSEAELDEHRRNKTDPWEANARLIAAAPELLEALADIMNRHASSVLFHDKALAEKAWGAIAKARGESSQ